MKKVIFAGTGHPPEYVLLAMPERQVIAGVVITGDVEVDGESLVMKVRPEGDDKAGNAKLISRAIKDAPGKIGKMLAECVNAVL